MICGFVVLSLVPWDHTLLGGDVCDGVVAKLGPDPVGAM